MLRLLLLLVSLSGLLTNSVQAGLLDSLTGKSSEEPQFLPVEQAFPLRTDVQGKFLIASWTSADGYYLYQHRIKVQQGSASVDASRFLHNGAITKGEEKQDEAFGLVTVFHSDLDAEFDLSSLQPGPATLTYQGCAEAGLCYPPQKVTFEVLADLQASAVTTNPASTTNNSQTDNSQQPPPIASVSTAASTTANTAASPATPAQAEPFGNSVSNSLFSGRSWLAVVGLFFLLGLGLTFTPCVLPMVPILTSVVLGQSANGQVNRRRALLLSSTYVLGMATTYALAGVTVGLLGAGANLQAWMQTPAVLIVFSVLFVALALSMFGLYELQLPSAIRNRLNNLSQQQQGGQFVGVLVIGILSALVVSPCVSAPLAGALVYIGSTGDAWLGGSALLALGLGMGAPLIILATSGASLLPKAGMWMNQVRSLFGVLLLAVAIWLLARLLPESLSLALWGVLATVYAIYLGAFDQAAAGAARLIKGLAWVLLIYGASALIGSLQGNSNPLQPLTGFTQAGPERNKAPFERTADVSRVNSLLASNNRVMLDLYADWCISCKIMDEEVFSQTDVQGALSHMRWVQLDITDQTPEQIAFLKSQAIFGPPTILFLNQGKEISEARITGEMNHQQFMEHLQAFGLTKPAP